MRPLELSCLVWTVPTGTPTPHQASRLGGVRDLLASPRRRRRVLTGAIGLIAVGGVTFSMIHWSNTSHFHMAPIRYNEKAQVAKVPVKADFRRAKKEGVLHVAAQFVNTAVRRKHVERSYDLATPTLK